MINGLRLGERGALVATATLEDGTIVLPSPGGIEKMLAVSPTKFFAQDGTEFDFSTDPNGHILLQAENERHVLRKL
jgi:hypothetical protein